MKWLKAVESIGAVKSLLCRQECVCFVQKNIFPDWSWYCSTYLAADSTRLFHECWPVGNLWGKLRCRLFPQQLPRALCGARALPSKQQISFIWSCCKTWSQMSDFSFHGTNPETIGIIQAKAIKWGTGFNIKLLGWLFTQFGFFPKELEARWVSPSTWGLAGIHLSMFPSSFLWRSPVARFPTGSSVTYPCVSLAQQEKYRWTDFAPAFCDGLGVRSFVTPFVLWPLVHPGWWQ